MDRLRILLVVGIVCALGLCFLPFLLTPRRQQLDQRPDFYSREHRLQRRPRLELDYEDAAAQTHLTHGTQQTETQSVKPGVAAVPTRNSYHVIVTSDDRIYMQWQVRVCFYWYNVTKHKHPASPLGGFTRVLHSGKPDGFMHEVPTVVVNPLPMGTDRGYVVLNRPYAVLQWVQKYAAGLVEDYVLMCEPDHIIRLPPPLWATATRPAAYQFDYITPRKHKKVLQQFNAKRVAFRKIDEVGSSPVMIHKAQLATIAPLWYSLSLRMKQDPATDAALGWVLDMYAYTMAASQVPGRPVRHGYHPEFMAHPPYDGRWLDRKTNKEFYVLHYTYGQEFGPDGSPTNGRHSGEWRWDKRDYIKQYPPKYSRLPPPMVTNEVTRFLVHAVNEAASHLHPWPG